MQKLGSRVNLFSSPHAFQVHFSVRCVKNILVYQHPGEAEEHVLCRAVECSRCGNLEWQYCYNNHDNNAAHLHNALDFQYLTYPNWTPTMWQRF